MNASRATDPRPPSSRQIALEGHDACGKTTLTPLLARALGGVAVAPFSDSLGDLIAWLWRNRDFERANELAQLAVAKAAAVNDGAAAIVFDRHWLTLATVLPESLIDEWRPFPPTVLLWIDAGETVRRLRERGEDPGDLEEHRHYCRRYRELAEANGVPILDTSALSIDETVQALVALVGA